MAVLSLLRFNVVGVVDVASMDVELIWSHEIER